MAAKVDHVNYSALDDAKGAFIAAGRKTLTFAKEFGFLPNEQMGASANLFALNLAPFFKNNVEQLYLTLVPEGLGTADDARPDDLSSEELKSFWYNIAIKTVATMTNDVASAGLQPILLSLYLPSSTPETVFTDEFMSGFLDGIVDGCRRVGCVYFSGETPQLKGKITEGKLDVAGATFGVLPPGLTPVNSSALSSGDQIVFVESSGPHENGFTSLRQLATKLTNGYRTQIGDGREFWEAINAASHLYTPIIQDALRGGIQLTNVEPITGHGWQKLMRSSKPLRYVIKETLPIPPVFSFVQKSLNLTAKEMIEIFNYGVGLALFVRNEADAKKIVEICAKHLLNARHVGHVEESAKRSVEVPAWNITLESDGFALKK